MYKRYSKILKKAKEESSSESESVEEQEELKYPMEGKDRENESSSEEDSQEEAASVASEDSEGIIESSTLTVEELEAGDEKVTRKPKRDEVLLYRCSICPEKSLTTLKEVDAHIKSQVCSAKVHPSSEFAWNSQPTLKSRFLSPIRDHWPSLTGLVIPCTYSSTRRG